MTPAHLAATRIDTPASFAHQQLSDVKVLGRWALGSMDFIATAVPEVWQGRSLFDGSISFVEIRSYPELGLIDYHVGSLELRVPRVSIRVTSGENWGLGIDACMAAMTTWRADWMDDERWQRTRSTHETEVLLFRAQIESAWRKQG